MWTRTADFLRRNKLLCIGFISFSFFVYLLYPSSPPRTRIPMEYPRRDYSVCYNKLMIESLSEA